MYKLQRVKWLCIVLCIASIACALGFGVYGKLELRDFIGLCALALIWGVIAYIARTVEKEY